jgi:hypothetical protein
MAIKISLLGEGPEDYGSVEGKEKPGVEDKYKGHIQLFVERILHALQGHRLYFQPFPLYPRNLHVHTYVRQEKSEKMEPLATRVRLAIQKARASGHQALVVLMDDRREDDKPILEKLKEGRQEAEQAGYCLPTALGTAIKEIEAWILADDKARPWGLGEEGNKPLEDAPEDIDDPKSRFSKLYGDYMQKLKEQGQAQLPDERMCQEHIIAQIDINTLSKRCPKGFKPFLEEIKTHILPLF